MKLFVPIGCPKLLERAVDFFECIKEKNILVSTSLEPMYNLADNQNTTKQVFFSTFKFVYTFIFSRIIMNEVVL